MNAPDKQPDPEPHNGEDFQRLLDAARNGSRDAVGTLIERYRPYLLMIANKEWDPDLRGKLGASDLVQESLLTAQHSIDGFDGNDDGDLRAWLRGILINDVREAKRRFKGTAKRQPNREVPMAGDSRLPAIDLPDAHLTPGTEAVSREEELALHAAMQRLPENYRQALHLRNWRQLEFAAIGEQLGCSAEAARKIWSRAVLQLQRELEAHVREERESD